MNSSQHFLSWAGALLVIVLLAMPARAAMFTVNNLGDDSDVSAGDGVCEATPAGDDCSLRAAIEEANALGGADVIEFSVNGTITLGEMLPAIAEELTIDGPGRDLLVVDLDGNDGPVFDLDNDDSGTTVQDVTIQDLTARGSGGIDQGSIENDQLCPADLYYGWGGGILVRGNSNLMLTNVLVTGNHSDGSQADVTGGGITISGGAALENVIVRGNSSDTAGGGIEITGRPDLPVTLTDVIVEDNEATGENPDDYRCSAPGGNGGGIVIRGAKESVTLERVTIRNNTAGGSGGGIHVDGSNNSDILDRVRIIDSVIEGNRAMLNGGGISLYTGPIVLEGSIIRNNIAGTADLQVEDRYTYVRTVDMDQDYSGKLNGSKSPGQLEITSGSVTIEVQDAETFTDNGDGTLSGDDSGTGTIDYDTGEWSISLGNNPGTDKLIVASFTANIGEGGAIEAAIFSGSDEENYSYGAPSISDGNDTPDTDAVFLEETLIHHNTAVVSGGGINIKHGRVLGTGVTLVANSAMTNGGGLTSAPGAGLEDFEGTSLVPETILGGALVSGNAAPTGPDCWTEILDIGNLTIGNPADCMDPDTTNTFGVTVPATPPWPFVSSDSCTLSPGGNRPGALMPLWLLVGALGLGVMVRRRRA